MKVLVATSGNASKEWEGSFYRKELPAGDVLRFSAGRLRTPHVALYEGGKKHENRDA
jgi:uncharacterized protein YecE (DUF72 family)